MLVMPVSGPWYEWLTSPIISSAVRRSPGAKGWFQAVKMNSSGSGQECYARRRKQYEHMLCGDKKGSNAYSSDLMEFALD